MKTAIHRAALVLGVSLGACFSMAQTVQNVPSAHFNFTAPPGTRPIHQDHAQLVSQNAGQVRGVMKNPDGDGNSGGYGVTTVLTPTSPGDPDILRQPVVTFVKHDGTIKAGDVFKVKNVDKVEGRLQGEGVATVLFSADILGTLKIEWKAVGTQGTVTVLKVGDQFVTLKIDGVLLNNAADSSGGSQLLVSGTFSYVPEPR